MLNQSTDMHASANILTRERAARSSRREKAEWGADDLLAVWEGYRDVIDDRLTTIERAIQALESGHLDAGLRNRAARAAHMLSGSLGMFGFGDASKAASDLELAFSRPTPDDLAELSATLARIRRDIS